MPTRSLAPLLLLIGLVIGLVGCGAAASQAPVDGGTSAPDTCTAATALQTVASAAGTYSVSACAADPVRGINAFTFLVTDASTSAPVDGLTIAVQPWMPDMGHGSPATPTVTALGDGLYQVADVVFTMGGLWQLRTTLSGGTQDSASDNAIVQFTID